MSKDWLCDHHRRWQKVGTPFSQYLDSWYCQNEPQIPLYSIKSRKHSLWEESHNHTMHDKITKQTCSYAPTLYQFFPFKSKIKWIGQIKLNPKRIFMTKTDCFYWNLTLLWSLVESIPEVTEWQPHCTEIRIFNLFSFSYIFRLTKASMKFFNFQNQNRKKKLTKSMKNPRRA